MDSKENPNRFPEGCKWSEKLELEPVHLGSIRQSPHCPNSIARSLSIQVRDESESSDLQLGSPRTLRCRVGSNPPIDSNECASTRQFAPREIHEPNDEANEHRERQLRTQNGVCAEVAREDGSQTTIHTRRAIRREFVDRDEGQLALPSVY